MKDVALKSPPEREGCKGEGLNLNEWSAASSDLFFEV